MAKPRVPLHKLTCPIEQISKLNADFSGCYLIHKNGQALYVGKSLNIANRVLQEWLRVYQGCDVTLWRVDDLSHGDLESYLIYAFRPERNVSLPIDIFNGYFERYGVSKAEAEDFRLKFQSEKYVTIAYNWLTRHINDRSHDVRTIAKYQSRLESACLINEGHNGNNLSAEFQDKIKEALDDKHLKRNPY